MMLLPMVHMVKSKLYENINVKENELFHIWKLTHICSMVQKMIWKINTYICCLCRIIGIHDKKQFLCLLCVNDCNSVQHGTVMISVAQQHEKTPKSVAWMSPLLGHWVSGPAAPAVGPRIKASFLGFSSWPQCSSDRGGETRSGSSGPHSHTGDRMPCCTILETSP